jgi:hypothetical protein
MSDEEMTEVFLELDKFEDSGGLDALRAILNHKYDILVGEPSPPAPAVVVARDPQTDEGVLTAFGNSTPTGRVAANMSAQALGVSITWIDTFDGS